MGQKTTSGSAGRAKGSDMAAVRLGRYEVKRQLLPAVCMQCGAEATVHRRKTFSWYPPWVIVLLLFGLLPFVIVALILTKRMTVAVPLCDQHKGHWTWRAWFIWGGFVFFVVLGVAAIILLASQENRRGGANEMAGWVCAATAGAGLIWLIVAAFVQSSSIRPSEITDTSITLFHVSPDFIDALKEERLRYPVEEDE
jgi:hypothetical protein